MTADDDSIPSLAAALAEARARPGSMFLTGSLEAAFSRTAEQRQALRDERLQDQTELDLHLIGANVLEHSTRADWLGIFMTRTSTAVKELAKGISGKQRHVPGLLVEGPGPGSVRVTFRSPPQKRANTLPGTETETLDGKALHQFASLFMLAEDEPDLLEGSVQRLPGAARRAMKQVGQQVVDASWSIEGNLAARGRGLQHVVITPNGAANLIRAVGEEAAVTEPTVVTGAVDGWTWSKSVMDFQPKNGRAFRAVVPPNLQEQVAAIVGQPNHDATGNFSVTTVYPRGDATYAHRSYVLEAIQAGTEDDLTVLIEP